MGNRLNDTNEECKCSACGKSFDDFDYAEDFTFDKYIGYGSIHDEEHIKFKLCCECFDKIFEVVKPLIKNIEIEEYDAFEKAGYGYIDLTKQLNK